MTHQNADKETISLTVRDVMVKEVFKIENASVKESADVMTEREIISIITTRKRKTKRNNHRA
jgi:CBS domain-containing protein